MKNSTGHSGKRPQSLSLVLVPALLVVLCGSQAEGEEAQPSRLLEGSTKTFELNLEKLRDLGLDLKNVMKNSGSLYDEVSIQPVQLITQPQMISNGTFIQIPIGTQKIGNPAPARKERVDLAMSELRPVVTLLKKDVDNFITSDQQLNMPENVTSRLQPHIEKWISAVGNMASQQERLDKLTQGPPYDNRAIGSLAASLQAEAKNLDKVRRDVYKILQKEGKRERKSK